MTVMWLLTFSESYSESWASLTTDISQAMQSVAYRAKAMKYQGGYMKQWKCKPLWEKRKINNHNQAKTKEMAERAGT